MALAAVFQSRGILMDGAQLSRSIVDIIGLLCGKMERHQTNG
jgi:hypothetical protein